MNGLSLTKIWGGGGVWTLLWLGLVLGVGRGTGAFNMFGFGFGRNKKMWRPNKFSVRKRIPNGKCNHTQSSLNIYVLINEKWVIKTMLLLCKHNNTVALKNFLFFCIYFFSS